MTYEELYHRFGTHVSQRIRRELSPSEFSALSIDNLTSWLEERAEAAHELYVRMLSHPVIADAMRTIPNTRTACQRWREAEDLAYLVAVADDVSAHVRVRI